MHLLGLRQSPAQPLQHAQPRVKRLTVLQAGPDRRQFLTMAGSALTAADNSENGAMAANSTVQSQQPQQAAEYPTIESQVVNCRLCADSAWLPVVLSQRVFHGNALCMNDRWGTRR